MSPSDDLEKVFAKFFTVYSAWNWATTPVSLIGCSSSGFKMEQTESMAILTPTKPCRNVCRNASRTSVLILTKEFERARFVFFQYFTVKVLGIWYA